MCFEGGRAWDREGLRKAVGEKVRYHPEQTNTSVGGVGLSPFITVVSPVLGTSYRELEWFVPETGLQLKKRGHILL